MDKLTIGIIGAGRIGQLHAKNLVGNHRVKLKAVSDVRGEELRSWADEHKVEILTTEYQDIIQDPDIDAILICSPTDTHLSIIKEAAKANKHIFCEKPVSFSKEQTEEALEAVNQHGVKLQVGFNRRFDANFMRVRELVHNGHLGDIHLLKITSRDPAPPPESYIRTSGGMFMDMTIHDFDMARYLLDSEVEKVYATGANLVDPAFGRCEDIDTAVVTLTFKNGTIAVIDNSRQAVYGYDQRVEAFGSKGSAETTNVHPNTVQVSSAEMVYRDKPLNFFLERYQQAYVTELEAFVDSVLSNSEITCSGFDGLQAERIASAAQQSLTSGQPVEI